MGAIKLKQQDIRDAARRQGREALHRSWRLTSQVQHKTKGSKEGGGEEKEEEVLAGAQENPLGAPNSATKPRLSPHHNLGPPGHLYQGVHHQLDQPNHAPAARRLREEPVCGPM